MNDIHNFNLCYIKGVGPKKTILFNKLGLYTAYDLIKNYPRTYDDWSRVTPIAQTVLNETNTVLATVLHAPTTHRISGSMVLYKTVVSDDEQDLHLTFFNNKYIPSLLKPSSQYYFKGKVTGGFTRREMSSPEFLPIEKSLKFMPIYAQTSGLNSREISKATKFVLGHFLHSLEDIIPKKYRQEYKLAHLNYSLSNIHFPKSEEDLNIARHRLIFEEFLILQLGLSRIKKRTKTFSSNIIKKDYTEEFVKLLPFSLTGAQGRAISEMVADLKKDSPMNRLLQGDVGSGKTAVASAICFTAIKNNFQCALMAPTEILASQHYHSLSKFLEPSGVKVELLTGSTTAKNKRIIREKLENGEIDLLIGTHALISDGVNFKNLGLIITDEQHRFGVNQRMALAKKGNSPHTLVMSATPIPRTLALMIYGDLDISILNELPPGRQTIDTYAVDSSKRLRAFNYVRKHLDEGRQGYIICPLIEEGESDLASVTAYAEILKEHFSESEFAILHGKMKPKEKDSVMTAFSNGDIKILLSTTVVEVGVDVPNAVIMLIENAERYGLSQLHQLRGRIGRGKHKSTCILISDAQNEESIRRLDIMKKYSDGFKIADEDLKMRGPGDFFGKKQHGLPEMKIADMVSDMQILKQAQDCALDILNEDHELVTPQNRLLKQEVLRLFKDSGNDEGMIL